VTSQEGQIKNQVAHERASERVRDTWIVEEHFIWGIVIILQRSWNH